MTRTFIIAAIIAGLSLLIVPATVFSKPPAQQESCSSGATILGITEAEMTGAGGLDGAARLCQGKYGPGARMATVEELVTSPIFDVVAQELEDHASDFAWLHPKSVQYHIHQRVDGSWQEAARSTVAGSCAVWETVASTRTPQVTLDCYGWTDESTSFPLFGAAFRDLGERQYVFVNQCYNLNPVVCSRSCN